MISFLQKLGLWESTVIYTNGHKYEYAPGRSYNELIDVFFLDQTDYLNEEIAEYLENLVLGFEEENESDKYSDEKLKNIYDSLAVKAKQECRESYNKRLLSVPQLQKTSIYFQLVRSSELN